LKNRKLWCHNQAIFFQENRDLEGTSEGHPKGPAWAGQPLREFMKEHWEYYNRVLEEGVAIIHIFEEPPVPEVPSLWSRPGPRPMGLARRRSANPCLLKSRAVDPDSETLWIRIQGQENLRNFSGKMHFVVIKKKKKFTTEKI
jgi:hypothetical protein